MKKLCAVSLAALFLALPAAGQEPGDWAADCNAASCTLSRSAINASNGQRAATLLAVISKDTTDITLGAVAPLGVALEPGIRLVFGEHSDVVPMEVCFPDGCRAVASFAADSFSGVDNIDIRYFPFGSDRPLSVLMAMDGFEQSVEKARAKLAGN